MAERVRCPGCGADVESAADHRPPSFPFCSSRCRVLDLGAWADGRYVIAGKPAFDLDDEDAATR